MFANYFKDLGPGAFYEALQQDPEAVLLDVRTEHEFEEVHLEGALLMNINSGVFLSEIETLDRSKHYYVYCAVGGRSKVACGIMLSRGFEHVYNLSGGLAAWIQKGLPVVKAEKQKASAG
jgi:rhodanese-related sulfurtransferase